MDIEVNIDAIKAAIDEDIADLPVDTAISRLKAALIATRVQLAVMRRERDKAGLPVPAGAQGVGE